MEPRAVARHRISRERRPTGLSEPIRQVVAAWHVTVFVLVAGLSVLVFHERGGRDDGVAAVALRWHSPPVAGAGEAGRASMLQPHSRVRERITRRARVRRLDEHPIPERQCLYVFLRRLQGRGTRRLLLKAVPIFTAHAISRIKGARAASSK